jgi:hypothetical protein
MYVIHENLLAHVAVAWAHWAQWLVERSGDEPSSVRRHADQVAMSLALAAEGIDVVNLGLRWNLPTHLSGSLPPDAGAPAVLHYHERVGSDGLIKPYGLPAVDDRIRLVNKAISAVFAQLPQHDGGFQRSLATQ